MDYQYENRAEGEKQEAENHMDHQPAGADSGYEENAGRRPRRFGRGIYDSKDVPIRLLDGFIAGIIVIIVVMVIVFALNGGYTVSFDTQGGTEIAAQKLRYGNFVEEPEIPIRQGYEFDGWYYQEEPDSTWRFGIDKVGGDITLAARWIPAKVTVKFDADGGRMPEAVESVQVMYQGNYGELPVPEKDGFQFAGWKYSGEEITEDSIVMMPGEHVLTAIWK